MMQRFLQWLKRPSARRARFIAAYTFPPELHARVRALRPDLSDEQADLVLDGLRQYFLACLAAQRERIARHVGMPSKAVDEAWHEFILMTREYARFCYRAFGRYLHHAPEGQMHEPMDDALANTLHQLKRIAPLSPGWAMLGATPLLFALDRELGIPGGHGYDEDTLARLGQKREAGTSRGAWGGCSAGSACGGGFTATSGAGHGGPCDAGSGSACDAGGASCGGASCGGGGCGSS